MCLLCALQSYKRLYKCTCAGQESGGGRCLHLSAVECQGLYLGLQLIMSVVSLLRPVINLRCLGQSCRFACPAKAAARGGGRGCGGGEEEGGVEGRRRRVGKVLQEREGGWKVRNVRRRGGEAVRVDR